MSWVVLGEPGFVDRSAGVEVPVGVAESGTGERFPLGTGSGWRTALASELSVWRARVAGRRGGEGTYGGSCAGEAWLGGAGSTR